MARLEDKMRVRKPRLRTAVKRKFPNPKANYPVQGYIKEFGCLNHHKPVEYIIGGWRTKL
jgi:hypothetical protein